MRTLIVSAALMAALLGTPTTAAAQTSDPGAYCLKTASGLTRCAYQTMAQCEQVKKSGDQCISRSETTGAAPSGRPPAMGKDRAPPSQSPSR